MNDPRPNEAEFKIPVGARVRSTFDTGPEENPRWEGVVIEHGTLAGLPSYQVRTEGGPDDGFVYIGWDDTLEALDA